MNRFGKADVCNGIVQRNVGRDNVFKEYIVFCCTIVSFLLANIRYYAGSGGEGRWGAYAGHFRTSVGLNKAIEERGQLLMPVFTFSRLCYLSQSLHLFKVFFFFFFFGFVFDSFFSEGQPDSTSQRSSKCAAFA